MIWKINFIFMLSSLHSIGFSLPHVQKRDISSTPNILYENDNYNKVLGVLKKVYPDLKNLTDSGQRSNEFPRTYGMSLTGQQGFVWNMLNDARKMFNVGSPRGGTVKQNDITERSIPEEEQAQPQEEQAQPQEEQAQPQEEQAQPQKEQAQPQEEQAQPQDKQAQRQEEQAQPQEEQAQPQEEQAQPQKEQAQPQEEQAQPQDKQAQPQEEQAQPQEEQAQPQEKQAQPQDKQAQPQDKQAQPQEEQAQPQEKQAQPQEKQAQPQEEQAQPQESEESVYLQIFSELLENDEFWEWLTGWIETYTELLEEHIKVEVEETVTKRIKEYLDRIDNLINEENSSQYNANVQLDEGINSGQGKGPRGFVNTQNISNSTVNNEYVANIYFTDPRAEKNWLDKVIKAFGSIRDNKDNGAQTDMDASTGESSVK